MGSCGDNESQWQNLGLHTKQAGMQNNWWRAATILEVSPRDFKHTPDLGLSGLTALADSLVDLVVPGLEAWLLTSVLASGSDPYGRDVRNFCDVDPRVGTQHELRQLLGQSRARNHRVLLDVNLACTSQYHPWFQESSRSADSAFASWYIWCDPRSDGTPPNNWLLPGGTSAWVWFPSRGQFALHQGTTDCPRLNYHHPEVQQAMLDVLRFWCDQGVNGFRLLDSNRLFHDSSLRSNLPTVRRRMVFGANRDLYAMQMHWYDQSQPENLAFLERVRAVLDPYEAVVMGHIDDVDALAMVADYTEGDIRLHLGAGIGQLNRSWTPGQVREQVKRLERQTGDGGGAVLWGLDAVADVPVLFGHAAPDVPEHLWLLLLLALKGTVCLRHSDFAVWDTEGSRQEPSSAIPQAVRLLLQWRQRHLAVLDGRQRWMGLPEPLLGLIRETDGEAPLVVVLNFSAEPQALMLPVSDIQAIENPGGLGGFQGTVDANRIHLPAYGVFVGVMGLAQEQQA